MGLYDELRNNMKQEPVGSAGKLSPIFTKIDGLESNIKSLKLELKEATDKNETLWKAINHLEHVIAEKNKEIIKLTGDPEAPARVDLLIENQELKAKLKKAKEFIKMMQSQTADLSEILK